MNINLHSIIVIVIISLFASSWTWTIRTQISPTIAVMNNLKISDLLKWICFKWMFKPTKLWTVWSRCSLKTIKISPSIKLLFFFPNSITQNWFVKKSHTMIFPSLLFLTDMSVPSKFIILSQIYTSSPSLYCSIVKLKNLLISETKLFNN